MSTMGTKQCHNSRKGCWFLSIFSMCRSVVRNFACSLLLLPSVFFSRPFSLCRKSYRPKDKQVPHFSLRSWLRAQHTHIGNWRSSSFCRHNGQFHFVSRSLHFNVYSIVERKSADIRFHFLIFSISVDLSNSVKIRFILNLTFNWFISTVYSFQIPKARKKNENKHGIFANVSRVLVSATFIHLAFGKLRFVSNIVVMRVDTRCTPLIFVANPEQKPRTILLHIVCWLFENENEWQNDRQRVTPFVVTGDVIDERACIQLRAKTNEKSGKERIYQC